MMSDYPSPYKGNEPYIFISYSHRNTQEALQIISGLINCGYRVWYDEGIDPGTEWDNNIADHVINCDYFIAMISEEYLASANCRDELQFARDENKNSLLIYLKDIALPSGMRLRFGRLQAIHKYKYESFNDFMNKLQEAENISKCKITEKQNTDAAKTVSAGSDQCLYDLYLTDYQPKGKVKIIKEVRRLTNSSLTQAKSMVDSVPTLIKRNAVDVEAAAIQKSFLLLGAVIELKKAE